MIEVPEDLSLREKINFLREKKPIIKFPEKVKYPPNRYSLPPTPEQAREYAQALLDYAFKKDSYDLAYAEAQKAHKKAEPQVQAIEKQITEVINEDVGLTKLGLSKSRIEKIWSRAWSVSDNEYEAIEALRELVELFKD